MRAVSGLIIAVLITALFSTLGGMLGGPASGEEQKGISFTTNYLHIGTPRERRVDIPITLKNPGSMPEEIELEIQEQPKEWTSNFRDRGYNIYRMLLPSNSTQSIDFVSEPPPGAQPGLYKFILVAVTKDKKVQRRIELQVKIEGEVKKTEVELLTTFPILKGSSTSSFRFVVDLAYRGTQDRNFDFSLRGPPGWRVSLKPQFERNEISSIRMKAGESRAMEVELSPPQRVAPGNYTFNLRAASGELAGSVDLKVAITGTFDMKLSSSTGRLNAATIVGQETHFTMVIENTGTSALERISLSSTKPSDWVLTFSPETIDRLDPKAAREVDITIKPKVDAIAGDYSITVRANEPNASGTMDIRVTVSTPPTTGIIGGIVVAIVVAFLILIFMRLGRR